MASLLPLEIQTEILFKLPAKSLQRFASVCKSWHSIITSSSFISSYHHRTSLNPQLFFLIHPHPHPLLPPSHTSIHFSLSSDSLLDFSSFKLPQSSTQHHDHDHNLRPLRVDLVTSNSINGVLCVLVYMGLSDGSVIDCDLFLWNPSTSEAVKLINSKKTGLFSGAPVVKFNSGFGFDGEDYKIVRVLGFTAEIFSLRENRWRRLVDSGITSNLLWASSSCTFFNGVGHWGVYNLERKDNFFVLGFDFRSECFKKINMPVDCVDGKEMRYHSLWVYKGMLAISVLRFGEFDSNITRHYIWVMMVKEGLDERHWLKLFNIDFDGGPMRPMVTLGNGEVLLLGEDDGEHALYDPELDEVQRVYIFDVDAVVYYVESLISFSQLMPK